MVLSFIKKTVFSIEGIPVTVWMILSIILLFILLLLSLISLIHHLRKRKRKLIEIEENEEEEEKIELIAKEEFIYEESLPQEDIECTDIDEKNAYSLDEAIERLILEDEEDKLEGELEMATAKKETAEKKTAKKEKVEKKEPVKKEAKKEDTKKVTKKAKKKEEQDTLALDIEHMKETSSTSRKAKDAPKKAAKKSKEQEEQDTLALDIEHMKEASAASYRSKVYHIAKRDDGKWQVKFAKGEKAIKTFATQAEAIEYAKQLANNQDGSIAIHKKDGKIRKLKY